MGFIKAPPGAVTRYLWVGGVHGMSVRQLAELFVPYGSPAVVLPEGQAGHQPAAPPPEALPLQALQLQPCGLLPHAVPPEGPPEQPQQQPQQQPQLRPPSPSSQPLPHYHVFLAFEAEGDAAAAMAAVPRAAPWSPAGGRTLVLNYADVRRDKRPVPRPVATSADGLGVPGLTLLTEFVSPEEEEALLTAVGAEEPHPAAAPGCSGGGGGSGSGGGGGGSGWEAMSRRRVQHFGYRFDYATRNVDLAGPLGPLPAWAAGLAERIAALPEVSQPLDQLTVNEYDPGVGLAPHVDTHSAFTGPIISLSLGSPAVMEMRRGEAARPLLLPARSLLVMGGESRYAWQHYIPHRVADLVGGALLPRARRVSLTFRQVRGFPCDCRHPDCCDSQQAKLPATRIAQLQQQQSQQQQRQGRPGDGQDADHGRGRGGGAAAGGGGEVRGGGGGDGGAPEPEPGEDEEARLEAMEAEHVHKVYDAIAPHFSSTRFAIWPRVRGFIGSLPAGAVVADVGCGNGKYFGVRRDVSVLGSDISAGLAAVAAQRLHAPGLPPAASPPAADALVADALRLPYRPASCDGALCIAVLHHLTSRRRRVRLLRQLLRVLRPGGGRALVTVWATAQEDPSKTLAKWTPIPAPDGPGGGAGPDGEGAARESNPGPAAGGDGASGGGDYFVPWHLPFHRTEAAKAAKEVKMAEEEQQPQPQPQQGCQGRGVPEPEREGGGGAEAGGNGGGDGRRGRRAKAGAAPQIDPAKGAVVFQRYYHLFEKEELVALVEEALAEGPAAGAGGGDAGAGGGDTGGSGSDASGGGGSREGCGVVEEVFYDRSNWCIVFRRDR